MNETVTVAILTMNRANFKLLERITLLFWLSSAASQAQSPYFQAITNLHPVGYWPMHEVEPPVPGSVETNLGTLGVMGTGYYTDWLTNNTSTTTRIIHGFPGALANDTDPSVFFASPTANQNSASNHCLIVPHLSAALTLKPPFTLEAWVYQTNSGFGVFIGEGGNAGLNGSANFDGFQLGCGLTAGNQAFQMQYYTGVAGGSKNNVSTANSALSNWWHCVVTYDGVNTKMYVNGNDVRDSTDTMAPSVWSPLVIGNGKYGGASGSPPAPAIRPIVAAVDEVAIYTNVITDISLHYTDGINGSAGVYVADVLADNPIVYLRMNAPAYTVPSVASWPALTNIGSATGNGVYTPGSIPSGIAGATYTAFPLGLSGANVAPFNGMASFADAGNNAAFNPTGSSAVFSVRIEALIEVRRTLVSGGTARATRRAVFPRPETSAESEAPVSRQA